MKKTILIIALLASSLAMTGCCGSWSGCDNSGDWTSVSTSGCCGSAGW